MEAGRPLDVFVSEVVMRKCAHRWEEAALENACPACGGATFPESIGTVECRKCGKRAAGLAFRVDGQDHCPLYSTNIAAAWEVVEHLEKQSIVLCLLDRLGYRDEDLSPLYRAEFMDVEAHEQEKERKDIWLGVAEAATAPLVISRAALLAILDEED
jgi:ribosomal protein L37AE/L43A